MACSSAAVGMRSRRRPSAASGRSQPDREQSTSTSRPPGRSTRVISGSPAGWSAQCAKETVLTTRSKLALGEQQPLGGRLRQAHPRVGAEGGPHLDHGRGRSHTGQRHTTTTGWTFTLVTSLLGTAVGGGVDLATGMPLSLGLGPLAGALSYAAQGRIEQRRRRAAFPADAA